MIKWWVRQAVGVFKMGIFLIMIVFYRFLLDNTLDFIFFRRS